MSTILLADDNPHSLNMGSQILGEEGYTVITLRDGNEVLSYLENHQPGLILVGTQMPGPAGLDICEHVRSRPALEAVRVVLLQSPLKEFDRPRAEALGLDGVLRKPLDANTLLETVRRLAGEPESADGPSSSAANGASRTDVPAGEGGSGEESPEDPDAGADLFARTVAQALSAGPGEGDAAAARREEVRTAVTAAVHAMQPMLIERITERVIKGLRLDGGNSRGTE